MCSQIERKPLAPLLEALTSPSHCDENSADARVPLAQVRHQTDENSGNTKMAPLKSPVAHPVIELFLACCLWPSQRKINTFFLSVMLSSSLSSPPLMLDLVTMVSICHLHVCVDLLSFSPMRFARRTLLLSLKKAPPSLAPVHLPSPRIVRLQLR